jgi:hypothetical protein
MSIPEVVRAKREPRDEDVPGFCGDTDRILS